jgi:hypothetical protein
MSKSAPPSSTVRQIQILATDRGAGLDHLDSKIAAGQVLDGLAGASGGERADPGRVDEADALVEAGAWDLDREFEHALPIAGISRFRDVCGDLIQRNVN